MKTGNYLLTFHHWRYNFPTGMLPQSHLGITRPPNREPLHDVCVRQGADIGSDHHVVVEKTENEVGSKEEANKP